jgi:DNA-binding IclR family transcriptional regulator
MSTNKPVITRPSPSLRAGIQSVEVAAPLLRALVESGNPLPLAALAAMTQMTRSKAHKYLASLTRTGLVKQEEGVGGRYSLGPFALEVGFAAMQKLDVLAQSQETLDTLRNELNTTCSLAVWTNRGPVLVRWAQTPFMLDGLRLGTVFPMLTSSFGRLFCAYLEPRHTNALVDAELRDPDGAAAAAGLKSRADVDRLMARVRADGLSNMQSVVAPGADVVSAPVFDHVNSIIGAIAAVGMYRQDFDLNPDGVPARAVSAAAARLSHKLGAIRVR